MRGIVVTPFRLFVGLGLVIGGAACGGEVGEAEPLPALEGSTSDPLIGGTRTAVRPEIGFISSDEHGSCTATLIAADVAITAAHCVDYQTRDEVGDYGWMGLDTATGCKAYTIDRYWSLGDDVGVDDLALVHLAEPVPASVATPATLAEARPARDADVTIFGYGCLERANESGSFEKRSAGATYQDSRRLCPGDSGGPVTLGEKGAIVAINSGFYVRSGDDIFADPIRHRAALLAQVAAWGPAAPRACLGGDQPSRAEPAPFAGEGQVCAGRDAWWAVAVEAGQTVVVEAAFDHGRGDIDLGLFGPSGEPLAKSDTTTDAEAIRHRAAAAGTYAVRVYGYRGVGNAVRLRISAE